MFLLHSVEVLVLKCNFSGDLKLVFFGLIILYQCFLTLEDNFLFKPIDQTQTHVRTHRYIIANVSQGVSRFLNWSQ